MNADLKNTIYRWARAGVAYAVEPARRSPDLDQLIVDTAKLARQDARLFQSAVSWLCTYYELIAHQRLLNLVQDQLDDRESAALGLLLDFVHEKRNTRHFRDVVGVCRPSGEPGPLFDFQRETAALTQLARLQACPLSRQWGLWVSDIEVATDSIRPARWVFKHNRGYRHREAFAGDLRATIIETLRRDASAGISESALARACRVCRPPLRDALDRLERYDYVERVRGGRNVSIQLTRAA